MLVEVLLKVGVGRLRRLLSSRLVGTSMYSIVALSFCAAYSRRSSASGTATEAFTSVAVLLEEHVLAHLVLERSGLEAVGAQRALVLLAADELAVLLEEGERHDLLPRALRRRPAGQAAGGLEPQLPLDHRVEDVAGQVERPLELGREIALVHLAVALDLGPVLAVELDRRDPLVADARDDLAGGILRRRAEPDQKTNPRMNTPITANSVHFRWWKLLRIVLSIENSSSETFENARL